ncbi:GNAT family N-acetyltransferase [Pseudoxanthomonas suwonensis]|uniref:N-acetyltransferase domain-containing protein n=1 Tax=Pseudoxanthomonas suwonensis TaxID=314722 RepID=A0A0E3UMK2_9GAMM|nr:GNAT family N-acetyltransferase [Pseudoxanthomonas suwonensis]AKC86110.1 hypothetical protein WQ53_04315 [Pseudoxanthomonas suwonensis]
MNAVIREPDYRQLLQVRRIGPGDLASYRTLRRDSLAGARHLAEPEVLREIGTAPDGLPGLFEQYEDVDTRLWGVFDRSRLVGVLGLSRGLETAHLWGAYVLPRYRGTPVSRLLMETAIACSAIEWKVDRLSARFASSNLQARRFLERFGFDRIDRGSRASVDFDDRLVWMTRDV